MSEATCPVCREPYLESVSTDRYTEGTFDESLPDSHPNKKDRVICYNVSAYPEGYHGFTLYFHPQTVTVIEEKWGKDGVWQEVGRFAKSGEAVEAADAAESDQDNHEIRWREAEPGV